MDRQTLSPDNNSTGKLEQGKIVKGFLFKTDEKLTEAIEKGMSYFYDPTPRLEIRIGLLRLFSSPLGRIWAVYPLASTSSVLPV